MNVQNKHRQAFNFYRNEMNFLTVLSQHTPCATIYIYQFSFKLYILLLNIMIGFYIRFMY